MTTLPIMADFRQTKTWPTFTHGKQKSFKDISLKILAKKSHNIVQQSNRGGKFTLISFDPISNMDICLPAEFCSSQGNHRYCILLILNLATLLPSLHYIWKVIWDCLITFNVKTNVFVLSVDVWQKWTEGEVHHMKAGRLAPLILV